MKHSTLALCLVVTIGLWGCDADTQSTEPDPLSYFDGYKTIGTIKEDVVMRLEDFKQYTPEQILEKFEGKEITITGYKSYGTNGGVDTRYNMCDGQYMVNLPYDSTVDLTNYDLYITFNYTLENINKYRAYYYKLPPLVESFMEGSISVPHEVCKHCPNDKSDGRKPDPQCARERLTYRPNTTFTVKIWGAYQTEEQKSRTINAMPTGMRYLSYKGD